MSEKTAIRPFERIDREIYAYTLPGVASHEDSIKVGETTGDVWTRIRQQTGTVGLNPNLEFQRHAMHNDSVSFTDKQLHNFFLLNNISKAHPNEIADEWFKYNESPKEIEDLTDRFINYDYREVQVSNDKLQYVLRKEQNDAVTAAAEYAQSSNESKQFLWNAKPRFGKTLSTYDLILRMKAKHTLIVTNRPAIANSWYDDFQKFIAWQDDSGKFKFVSNTDALKNKAMTRDEYTDFFMATKNEPGEDRFVAFISLQDLKGAEFAGGRFNKLEWVKKLDWDLLVIDEAHEGVDTYLTEEAFEGISRNFTLHLSGTPFKALADDKFLPDQIYNWSYVDEQEAKTHWDYAKGENPYEDLPELSLFTYQMSKLIEERISQGVKIESEANLDYAFDLNEFFKTKENGSFEHEADVIKFLDKLCTGNLPFSSEQYRSELAHTFWLLPYVANAKALQKVLNEHHYFKDYKVVLAAGDGMSLDAAVTDYNRSMRSYDKVKAAIRDHERTITLSVGQLTTGVTIPQWTAVFMLNNIQSPSQYFQAAFRAQNPYEYVHDGKTMRKERSYIFDFAPERTLQLFSDFATGLAGSPSSFTAAQRDEQIKNLLNFFPVISEDDAGAMYPLELSDILTIPNRIKSTEVISRGFMSNLLFANIANIFNAPQEVIDLLEKIPPEKHGRHQPLSTITRRKPMVDDKGNVDVPDAIVINTTKDLFGEKIYKLATAPEELLGAKTSRIAADIVEGLDAGFQKLKPEFKLTNTQVADIKKKAKKKIGYEMAEALDHYQNDLVELKQKEEVELSKTSCPDKRVTIQDKAAEALETLNSTYSSDIESRVEKVVQQEVESAHVKVETKKKNDEEGEVRDHLRGFTRTIPAFLMAYGTKDTTLSTYDENIDPTTFEELTGITIEQFRRLRDGFEYQDEQGQPQQFPELFNRAVFDASIKAFFEKKHELADYFDDDLTEDIFDYIPPQQTNQIFTPKWVVKKMVDLLEEENPDIFVNPDLKFIDLYTKSGLYPAEIVKRLNRGLADQMPDETARLKHIFENQVYSLAPSNIIYHIAKNFLYGERQGVGAENLIEYDLTPDAKDGTAVEKLKELFGENMKFDVVIGNPPYQEVTTSRVMRAGQQKRVRNIFQEFQIVADNIEPQYSTLIYPGGRWIHRSGKGMKSFGLSQINSPHLDTLYFYPDADEIFPNVGIADGISIVVKNYSKQEESFSLVWASGGSERRIKVDSPGEDLVILNPADAAVGAKLDNFIVNCDLKRLSESDVINQKLFQVESDYAEVNPEKVVPFDGKTFDSAEKIKLLVNDRAGKMGRSTWFLADRDSIQVNKELINEWQVVVSSANAGGQKRDNQIGIIDNQSAFGRSRLALKSFKTEREAKNFLKYAQSDIIRYAFLLTDEALASLAEKVPDLLDYTDDNSLIDFDADIDNQMYILLNITADERLTIEERLENFRRP